MALDAMGVAEPLSHVYGVDMGRRPLPSQSALAELGEQIRNDQRIIGEYRKFVESFDPKWPGPLPDQCWIEFGHRSRPDRKPSRRKPLIFALLLVALAIGIALAIGPMFSDLAIGPKIFIASCLCGALGLILALSSKNPSRDPQIDAQRPAEPSQTQLLAERCDSQNAAWLKGDVEWGMYGRGSAPTPLTICFTPVDHQAIRLRPAKPDLTTACW